MKIVTLLLGVRSITISVFVCLDVCLIAGISKKTRVKTSRYFSVRVTCGRGSILLFVDKVMFSHSGANLAEPKTILCLVEFARWRQQSAAELRTLWRAPEAKSATLDYLNK